jgi:hypothetical protein
MTSGRGKRHLRGQFTFFPQKRIAASRLARAEKSELSPALIIARQLAASLAVAGMAQNPSPPSAPLP